MRCGRGGPQQQRSRYFAVTARYKAVTGIHTLGYVYFVYTALSLYWAEFIRPRPYKLWF